MAQVATALTLAADIRKGALLLERKAFRQASLQKWARQFCLAGTEQETTQPRQVLMRVVVTVSLELVVVATAILLVAVALAGPAFLAAMAVQAKATQTVEMAQLLAVVVAPLKATRQAVAVTANVGY